MTNTDGVAVQQYSFNFTAGTAADNAAPTIVSVAPTNNATNIGTNAARFGELQQGHQPGLGDRQHDAVDRGLDHRGPLEHQLQPNYTRVSITPQAPLPASTQMTVAINGVTSQSGTAVASHINELQHRGGAGLHRAIRGQHQRARADRRMFR